MLRVLKQFASSRHGNFGVLTALMLVPVIGTAGLALDFSHALSLRTQLYAAADAAAVGSVAEKSDATTTAMAMATDGTVSVAESDARKLFMSQMSGEISTLPINLTIGVTKTSNKLQSSVKFTASVPTTFMKILGKNSIDISGVATAQYEMKSFMDFYILIDNTPSMGVGATTADINLLKNNTGGCAFACHNTDTTNNNYAIAKRIGAMMRIDIVRDAATQLTETATTERVSSDQFRMAAYTFGATAETATLTEVVPLTANLDTVASKISEKTKNPKPGDSEYVLDLMTIPYQNYKSDQLTSFDTALTKMNDIITTVGSGTSTTDREKIVFFVSDGVGDSNKPGTCTERTTGGRCQEPIDISFCKTLKDRGVKIAVLYTTYLPLPENGWYMDWIDPFHSDIPAKMAACATPGLYFEVSPTEGITDAMNALFLKVIHTPRLTG